MNDVKFSPQGKTQIDLVKELTHQYNHTINGNETALFLSDKVVLSTTNKTTGKTWNYTTVKAYRTYKKSGKSLVKQKPNFLGIIVFSVAVGITVGSMGKSAATFVAFVTTLNEIIMKLVILVMW